MRGVNEQHQPVKRKKRMNVAPGKSVADGIEHEQEQHGESSKKKRKRYQISDDEDEAELTNGEQELEQMLELNEDETESVNAVNAEGSLDESEVEEQSGQIELVEITLDKYYAIKYEIDSKKKNDTNVYSYYIAKICSTNNDGTCNIVFLKQNQKMSSNINVVCSWPEARIELYCRLRTS
jgi:hypothetical protein